MTVKNVIQIQFEIAIYVNVKEKIQEEMGTKKIILGIFLHVVVKMVDMQETLLTIQ